MPNSLRFRINKLVYQDVLSAKDGKRINEALDKQTPMKPIKVTEKDGWGWNIICPRCKEVEFGCNAPNYCDDCGQAIDWSGKI